MPNIFGERDKLLRDDGGEPSQRKSTRQAARRPSRTSKVKTFDLDLDDVRALALAKLDGVGRSEREIVSLALKSYLAVYYDD